MSKLATVLVAAVLLSATVASAASLTTEYSISAQVTQLGPQKFEFQYTIHNNDQEAPPEYGYTGLDGFLVYLPASAVISDVTVPVSFHGDPGYWVYVPGPDSYLWWGLDPSSVYPAGSDAVFSFVADDVSVGQTAAQLTTFWAGYNLPPNTWYTQYDATITGPVAVPLPSALSAGLSLGGIGLLSIWRRRHSR